MSIPKIIHYCWFGNGEKSDIANKCISSWKDKLMDYEIIEWNEKSFDINCNQYVKEAYELGKYAFVADYARLYALYNYGGIYMDTDVEVIKSLDCFLQNKGVVGFESDYRVATAIMMFEKKNELVAEWLRTYDNRKFIINGKMDKTTNVSILTKILVNSGLVLEDKYQFLEKRNIKVFSKEFFNPYSLGDKKVNISNNTYTIHWLEGTWVCGKDRVKNEIIKITKAIIGKRSYEFIRQMLKK